MKRALLFFLYFFLVILLLLAIASLVPFPLNPYLDFQVLYRADLGILRGIPLYDLAGQAQMVADDLAVPVDRVFVLPFPYPPWYAVAALPLALLPIDVAVRMWFLLNLVMYFVSVWLLTDGWEPRKRLYSFLVAFFFLPAFGALIVGQYVFPAILGIALTIYGLRHQQVGLLALGMGLVTFKPHVGMVILLPVLVSLLLRRDPFGRRAFWATALTGLILFFLGFLADPGWPVAYMRSLSSFAGVSKCQLCVSLPLTIAQMTGAGFERSALVAAALLVVFVALFLVSRYGRCDEGCIAFFVCTALLVNPYLQNYDFAFALVPLLYLAGSARSKFDWLWIALVFLLPWVGLGLFGRAGNSALFVVTVVMMIVILTRLYKDRRIALTH